MYNPPTFREDRPEALRAIMQTASLPVLVSQTANGLVATHLPLMFFSGPDRLIGHVAKANNQWRDILPGTDSLAIFTAAEGYISPGWYATKQETGKVVPTWNYEAVHATGRLEIIEDSSAILPIVTQLTERYEGVRKKPWAVSDAPDDYIAAQLKGIVGVVLYITRLEGKVKLSQNKSAADQAGVVAGLESENPALAAAMKRTLG